MIDAIAAYLRESNANLGGHFGNSRRSDALLTQARLSAASFLWCDPDETIFGANMTTLNFALSRTVGRTLSAGDEIVVTRLDHDGNVSPWLELAHDLDLTVRFADIADDTTLDLADLERQLSDRTRIVAFPLASNAVGTIVDARRVVGARARCRSARLGRRRPLRAARADRRRVARRRRAPLLAVQVLRAAPRARLRARRARRSVAHVQGAPRAPSLRDGDARARAARRLRRRGRLRRLARLGRDQRARANARNAFPRNSPRELQAVRPAGDGRTRPDVRIHRRRRPAERRGRARSGSSTSPCGTGTTTRSR